MRAVRVVLTIVAAGVTGALTIGPAEAGGAESLEFDERRDRADYLVVGRAVTGEMAAYFDDRRLEGEQFYAYLEPVSGAGNWYGALAKLSPEARLLGPISLGPFRSAYAGYQARATLTFTVPDVSPGRYIIEYCNSPCTEAFGSSSNGDTLVTIVATPGEARLHHRIDRLDAQLRAEIWQGDRRDRRRINSLTRRVAGPQGLVRDADALREQNRSAARRIELLEAETARLRAEVDGSETPWLAYGLAAAAMLALAVVVLRTGRKPTDVRVSLVEHGDPTLASWELVREENRETVGVGPR